MTGITMALIGAGEGGAGGGGGGSAVPSPTPVWTNIYGQGAVSTNTPAISGLGQAISIEAALSGLGALSYIQNGTYYTYTGAITVNPGDTLGWAIVYYAPNSNAAGNLTVTNESDAGAVLATIPYSVNGNNGPQN
jgi:hypothetical protein